MNHNEMGMELDARLQALEAEVKEKDEKLRANEITMRRLENEMYNVKNQNMRMIAAGGDKAYQAKFEVVLYAGSFELMEPRMEKGFCR